MLSVGGLYCYPVKSAGGFAVDELRIGRLGPVRDRQWVVVDERGMFVAQRAERGLGVAVPELCLVSTSVSGDELVVGVPTRLDVPSLRLPLVGVDGPEVDVTIWNDVAHGTDQGAEAAAWLDAVLGRWRAGRYRLVRMPDAGTRTTRDGDAHVGYADGYPLLVASEASLTDLNVRIARRREHEGEPPADALGWERFRPNLVVAGAAAYAEDGWSTLESDGVRLSGRTLCKRCPIPTTDQRTARRGREPLRTLATYRRHPDASTGGVVFARNFVHHDPGVLRLGAPVTAA